MRPSDSFRNSPEKLKPRTQDVIGNMMLSTSTFSKTLVESLQEIQRNEKTRKMIEEQEPDFVHWMEKVKDVVNRFNHDAKTAIDDLKNIINSKDCPKNMFRQLEKVSSKMEDTEHARISPREMRRTFNDICDILEMKIEKSDQKYKRRLDMSNISRNSDYREKSPFYVKNRPSYYDRSYTPTKALRFTESTNNFTPDNSYKLSTPQNKRFLNNSQARRDYQGERKQILENNSPRFIQNHHDPYIRTSQPFKRDERISERYSINQNSFSPTFYQRTSNNNYTSPREKNTYHRDSYKNRERDNRKSYSIMNERKKFLGPAETPNHYQDYKKYHPFFAREVRRDQSRSRTPKNSHKRRKKSRNSSKSPKAYFIHRNDKGEVIGQEMINPNDPTPHKNFGFNRTYDNNYYNKTEPNRNIQFSRSPNYNLPRHNTDATYTRHTIDSYKPSKPSISSTTGYNNFKLENKSNYKEIDNNKNFSRNYKDYPSISPNRLNSGYTRYSGVYSYPVKKKKFTQNVTNVSRFDDRSRYDQPKSQIEPKNSVNRERARNLTPPPRYKPLDSNYIKEPNFRKSVEFKSKPDRNLPKTLPKPIYRNKKKNENTSEGLNGFYKVKKEKYNIQQKKLDKITPLKLNIPQDNIKDEEEDKSLEEDEEEDQKENTERQPQLSIESTPEKTLKYKEKEEPRVKINEDDQISKSNTKQILIKSLPKRSNLPITKSTKIKNNKSSILLKSDPLKTEKKAYPISNAGSPKKNDFSKSAFRGGYKDDEDRPAEKENMDSSQMKKDIFHVKSSDSKNPKEQMISFLSPMKSSEADIKGQFFDSMALSPETTEKKLKKKTEQNKKTKNSKKPEINDFTKEKDIIESEESEILEKIDTSYKNNKKSLKNKNIDENHYLNKKSEKTKDDDYLDYLESDNQKEPTAAEENLNTNENNQIDEIDDYLNIKDEDEKNESNFYLKFRFRG